MDLFEDLILFEYTLRKVHDAMKRCFGQDSPFRNTLRHALIKNFTFLSRISRISGGTEARRGLRARYVNQGCSNRCNRATDSTKLG